MECLLKFSFLSTPNPEDTDVTDMGGHFQQKPDNVYGYGPGNMLRETSRLISISYQETRYYFLCSQGEFQKLTSETHSLSTVRQIVLTWVVTVACSLGWVKEHPFCCFKLDFYQLSIHWESHLGSLRLSSFSVNSSVNDCQRQLGGLREIQAVRKDVAIVPGIS